MPWLVENFFHIKCQTSQGIWGKTHIIYIYIIYIQYVDMLNIYDHLRDFKCILKWVGFTPLKIDETRIGKLKI